MVPSRRLNGRLVSTMNDLEERSEPMALRFDQSPVAIYITSLGSENSRESVKWCLNLAASVLSNGRYEISSLDWSKLRYQHISALKSKLNSESPTPCRDKPYSISTVNMVLSAVRGVMKQCKKLRLISSEHLNDILDVKGVRGDVLPSGRALTPDEVRALFRACGDGIIGSRDRAILAILLGAGLRRSELSALDMQDWHEDDLLITVRRGKGRKGRQVPVGSRVGQSLHHWLQIRGYDPGPMILSVNRGGVVKTARLRTSGVYFMLQRRSLVAGIPKVSPHDCRRTYITNLLLNGADLATAASLAGHSSIETTAIYDRRGIDSLREAAKGLVLPM